MSFVDHRNLQFQKREGIAAARSYATFEEIGYPWEVLPWVPPMRTSDTALSEHSFANRESIGNK